MRSHNIHLSRMAFILSLSTFLTFYSCKKEKPVEDPNLTGVEGTLTDTDGNPVTGATVEIVVFKDMSDKEPEIVKAEVGEDGSIKAEVPEAVKYVMNIRSLGHGLISKVYYKTIPKRDFKLRKATVASLVNSSGAVITDNSSNCPGSLSSKVNWTSSANNMIPVVVDSAGNITDFGMDDELLRSFTRHAIENPCNTGASVSFPAGAVNGPNNLNVAISTIDLFSQDGMPGDNTTTGLGFMESFGAVSIDVYDDDGKRYNLNREKEATATVKIPVDMEYLSKVDFQIPESVPLLSYDETLGQWKAEGKATFNREEMVFEAEVTHFSAINFDIEKTTPSCVRIKDDQALPPNPTYKIEVTVPNASMPSNPMVRTRSIVAANICSSPGDFIVDNNYAITRLPENTTVCLTFFDDSTVPATLHGIYVVNTGVSDSNLTDPTLPGCDATEFGYCNPSFVDFNTAIFTNPIMLAACSNGLPVSSFLITIASSGTFDPSMHKVKFTCPSGDTVIDLTNPAFTLVSGTTGSGPTAFDLYKYSINKSDVCADVFGFSAIIQDSGDNDVSNSTGILPCG